MKRSARLLTGGFTWDRHHGDDDLEVSSRDRVALWQNGRQMATPIADNGPADSLWGGVCLSADRVLVVRRSRLVLSLSVAAAALVATSVAFDGVEILTGHDRVFGLRPLFVLDYEANVPTFFSACLLLLSSALLAANGLLASEARRERWYWFALACVFLFMAVDEAARIHELTSRPTQQLVRGLGVGLGSLFRIAWVVPAMVVTVIGTVLFASFLRGLPSATRFRFVLAGLIYVCGAIGMELVAGAYAEATGFKFDAGYAFGQAKSAVDAGYAALYTAEEALEMAGVIVFINALLAHIEVGEPEGRWRVQRR